LIKIIRHKNPVPVCDLGDILYPFKNWDSTSTGDGFFSKPDESFYGERKFLPLNSISSKVWEPLKTLDIDFEKFKEWVSYECPYTGYLHYNAIPVYLFSDKVNEIVDNTKRIVFKDMYKDHDWQVSCHGFNEERVFQITSIMRSFMGAGYSIGRISSDGDGYKKDAVVALDNGDYLGFKVWVWYNK